MPLLLKFYTSLNYLHSCSTSLTSGPVNTGTFGATGCADGKVPDRASNGSTSYTHIKINQWDVFNTHTVSDNHTTQTTKIKSACKLTSLLTLAPGGPTSTSTCTCSTKQNYFLLYSTWTYRECTTLLNHSRVSHTFFIGGISQDNSIQTFQVFERILVLTFIKKYS